MRGLAAAGLTAVLGSLVLFGTPGSLETASTYDRDAFEHWSDLDGDRCNTRMEVLQRDLTRERVLPPCKVVSGVFRDPYAGVGGLAEAAVLDVDHVVSLGDAWRSGASSWTAARREAFANDERNLVATNRSQNRRKGDKGPADWVPPNKAHHCAFARTIKAVKDHYGLSTTPRDRAALARLRATC